MLRIQGGSVEAFDEIYDRHVQSAFRIARSVCRDDCCAEEAVQNAFVCVWRDRDSYCAQGSTPAAWVMTIVRHRAIDVARASDRHASRRDPTSDLDTLPARGEVAEDLVRRVEAERVVALLDGLPEAQREVITLAYFGGLTHTEIAGALSLPAGTVKGRMRLGLNKLRGAVATPATPATRASP